MNTFDLRKEFLLTFKPTEWDIKKKRTVRGKNYVAFINNMRNMHGLIKTLTDELQDNATVEQMWLNKSTVMGGPNVVVEKLDVFLDEPAFSKECVHVLFITSDDVVMLDYTKHIINRYMLNYSDMKQKYFKRESMTPRERYERAKKVGAVKGKNKLKRPNWFKKTLKKVLRKAIKSLN